MTDRSLVSRRTLLAAIGATALPLPAHAAAPALALYAGGYNREGGRGLVPLSYRPDTETWTAAAPVAAAPDASFGVRHPRLGLHYLVQEGEAGMVSVFRTSGDRWTRVAHVSSGGADPCHVALDRTGTALAVANYSSGSVALIRLDPATGLPAGEAQVRAHPGSGPVADRQASAHAHWVGFTPDNRWLWAVDLGADRIFAHPFADGKLGPAKAVLRAEPGSGPRHLALHPSLPFAYLVNELSNTITTLHIAADAVLHPIATHSTLPAKFTGKSQAGAIAIDAAGAHLYASNRGADSIAVYAIGRDGALTTTQHVACGGRWPRHIRLLESEARLLVANQHSGTIDSFTVAADGRLTPHGPGTTAPGVAFIGLRD
ncbi:lactonase family protein [Sphingomonas sp.]|uniref:lactonase family protein n=1 Tax=Sphingomonas sp. TaxID=28214 RepID=UPI0035AF8B03